jgi:outer membrane protein assembly factor BamD (BamD/ComL family)
MTTSLDESKEHLVSAKSLLLWGEYKASLGEAQKVLNARSKVLGGEALFLVGLIYAFPDNPDRDYKISIERFRRLIEQFPRSGLKDQAEMMVMYIGQVMERDKKLREFQKKNGRLLSACNKEKAKAQELTKEAERLHEEVQKLREQLVKLKEIDLVIEEKKQAQ